MSQHLDLPDFLLADSIQNISDTMSELSDVPWSTASTDLEDFGEADPTRGPSYSPISVQDFVDDGGHDDSDSAEAASSLLSRLESLPTELLQDIATRATTDLDLSSLILTSPIFSSMLSCEAVTRETTKDTARGTIKRIEKRENCIWRQRFLARYDYPFLENTLEFPFAYKVRQFILQGFDAAALGFGLKGKSGHQLDVVKDMILETYNRARDHEPIPEFSKNLAIFSGPDVPTWVIKLMSCSLYGGEKRKHGQPHFLFDTLQVTLSHLVLSPQSRVLAKIPSSRDNYDLARVYNYNKPFATILQVMEEEPVETQRQFRSSTFPNLGSRSPTPPPEEPQYRIDMHTLLHIRNFWQRHFTEDKHGIGENTYSTVIRNLLASGITPRQWDQPLQQFAPFNKDWYGNYSCTHPWPKNKQDLEERQSCAEDWKSVDPMALELETSMTNDNEAFWPELFADIPAFADIMPDAAFAEKFNVTYVRGIAPFMDLGSPSSFEGKSKSELPKWHPYLASRVYGFVHDVPNETLVDEDAQERRNNAYDDDKDEPVPGWKHIVMVIWKSTTRSLLAVLDHAEEEYGGASGTQISADFNTASVWDDGTDADTIVVSAPATGAAMNNNNDNTAVSANAGAMTMPTQPTEAQIEAQLKILLARRIKSVAKKHAAPTTAQFTKRPSSSSSKPQITPFPRLWSPEHIRTLEESFSAAKYLAWDDGAIDYAYAYEGIIIPGGKIMMGRWWRIHGIEGLGPGREVGPDGVGVEVKPVQGDSVSGSTDADTEDSGSAKKKGKGKAKAKASGKKATNKKGSNAKSRRPKRRGKKRKAGAMADSDDEFVDSEDEVALEETIEYEFVTVVNGEESRAVNGCKGLERGPFVFWAA